MSPTLAKLRALGLAGLGLACFGAGPAGAGGGNEHWSVRYPAYHAAVAMPEDEVAHVVTARYDARETVYKGYGGPTIEHHFGREPCRDCRPYNRHYYPYVYGGYGFSAPYFVKRDEYHPQRWDHKLPYGWRQKRWWGKDARHPDRQDEGRW
jgi:hypothetical protein